jgi:hypothetical protein
VWLVVEAVEALDDGLLYSSTGSAVSGSTLRIPS